MVAQAMGFYQESSDEIAKRWKVLDYGDESLGLEMIREMG